jgi:hypothetical protein
MKVIWRGTIKTTAFHLEFRFLRHLELHTGERAILVASMHAGQLGSVLIGQLKGRASYADRPEQMLVEISPRACPLTRSTAFPVRSMPMP